MISNFCYFTSRLSFPTKSITNEFDKKIWAYVICALKSLGMNFVNKFLGKDGQL